MEGCDQPLIPGGVPYGRGGGPGADQLLRAALPPPRPGGQADHAAGAVRLQVQLPRLHRHQRPAFLLQVGRLKTNVRLQLNILFPQILGFEVSEM